MSVNFDGSDESYYTTSSSSIPSGSSFTICFWVKFDTLPISGDFYAIINWRNSSGSNCYFELEGSSKTVICSGMSGDVDGIQAGVWYRVALVRNGSNSALYWTSSQTGSIGSPHATGSISIPSSPNRFTIASSGSTSSSEELDGKFANLKIWNRVLTTTEIQNELGTYAVLNATNLLRHHKWINAGSTPDAGTASAFSIVGSPDTSTDNPTALQHANITSAGGIGSGEAFGRATVQPGPINLTGAGGIPTAEAMGSTVVAQGIVPTGIPSEERFGRTHMDGGIHPNGIPSALEFGETTVSTSAVVIAPNGIPRPAITFGTAVVLGSVLAPTGIPSTPKLFGTPDITRGPVTITSAGGIGTREKFGFTKIIREVVALRSEVLAKPKPKVTYEVVVVSRIPQLSGPPIFFEIAPIDWTKLSYTEKISGIPTLDFTCQFSKLSEEIKQRLRKPNELGTEVWVNRNGKRVFSGPWVGAQVSGEDLSIAVNGLLYYLEPMAITADKVFKATDQFTIVKTLIDDKQAMPYAHKGIDTSSITTSGITLDITYLRNEENKVLDKIMALGKSANGFDIQVDPESRMLELYHPQVGMDRSSGPEAIVFDDRNVTDTNIVLSIGPHDLATDFYGVGTGSGQDAAETYYAHAGNDELRAQYGATDYVASFRDVSSQAQLDALVAALRDARGEALWIPGPNVRVTPDADLSAYDVGDIVSYTLHNELGVRGAFRLLERTVEVEGGSETVSASFV